jgi:hypothetical protein
MKCWVCSSKGGFANQLEIHLDGTGNGIVICQWCASNMRMNAVVACRE